MKPLNFIRNYHSKLIAKGKNFIEEQKFAKKSVEYADLEYSRWIISRRALAGAYKKLLTLGIESFVLENGECLKIKQEIKRLSSIKKEAKMAVVMFSNVREMVDDKLINFHIYWDVLETLKEKGVRNYTYKYKGKQKVNVDDELCEVQELINDEC